MKPSGTQLTGRDVEILRWIGRHGIVTVDQVSARFFGRDGPVLPSVTPAAN